MLCRFSITQRGESHKKYDRPCQDSSRSFTVPSTGDAKYVVAIVADGVGSEEHSDKGSKCSVDVVANYIQDELENEETSRDCKELIEDAFETTLEAMLDLADARQEPFSKFATTLTVAVYDGRTLWYGHAGDDGIVVMRNDGTYEMVTERHEGELSNSVIPFGAHHWQFGEADNVASCVLMTDGILDYCVGDDFEGNRVKLPFLEPLLYAVLESNDDVESISRDWADFLGAPPEAVDANSDRTLVFRDFVGDDLSLALLSNSEAVSHLPEYSFDLEAWEHESERFDAMREEALSELERKRLEEDASYRELALKGKERAPRNRRRNQPAATQDSTPGTVDEDASQAARKARLPIPPDGIDGQVPGFKETRMPRPPRATGEGDDWSQSIADGACDVIRGISIIGDALGDAVQDLLRKP